jgi:hypothetical protein
VNLKTDELTLEEVILVSRIQKGDMEAVPELLRLRVLDENFDPLKMPWSEVVKLVLEIGKLADEHTDEVAIFVNKLK